MFIKHIFNEYFKPIHSNSLYGILQKKTFPGTRVRVNESIPPVHEIDDFPDLGESENG